MLYHYNNNSVLGNMGRRDTTLEQDGLGFGAEAEVTMWSEVCVLGLRSEFGMSVGTEKSSQRKKEGPGVSCYKIQGIRYSRGDG